MRALLVITILALAGCASDPVEQDDEFDDVTTTDTTGAIGGVVVSELVEPLVGATVAMADLTATTDAEGRFVFENLEPNVYFLEASLEGYLAAQTSVSVVAGEVSKAQILLAIDQQPQPYHFTNKFDGYMEAYGTIGSFVLHLVLQEAGVSICECEWDLPLDEIPADVVVEGYWTDSVPDPRGPQQYYLEVFDWSISDCLDTGSHASGFRTNITECAWTEERYRVALTGPEDWIALQQTYELFVTTFYREGAPADWSVTQA